MERPEHFRVAARAIKLQPDYILKLYKRAEFACHTLIMTGFYLVCRRPAVS